LIFGEKQLARPKIFAYILPMSKQESINWIISLTEGEVNIDTLSDMSAEEAEEAANRLIQKKVKQVWAE
jgi:hypothetical protein